MPELYVKIAEMVARAYEDQFPDDAVGHKRAYNVGRIFKQYRENLS
jgi:hypothetical protein